MIVAQEYVSLYLNIRCKGKKQRLFAPNVAQSISILKIQNVNKCSRFGLFEFGVISRCSKFILINADTIYKLILNTYLYLQNLCTNPSNTITILSPKVLGGMIVTKIVIISLV